MTYWNVYYEENGRVTPGTAVAPDGWSGDRVRRYMKFQARIEGPVLVESAQAVDTPDFVLDNRT